MNIKKREQLENILFTAPALILVALMMYIPFLLSAYYSFTDWSGLDSEPVFVGLANFKALFSEGNTFVPALIFTFKYTILFVILSNIVALFLALFLSKPFKTATILRGVYFTPYVISMTIIGFIWRFILTQGFASLYTSTGLGLFDYSWVGDAKYAFISIVIVGTWQSIGFYIVLYIAGLKAIPQDVLEAASIDGASAVQKFKSVILPLLTPSITICMFMAITNGLKVFDIILALTKGGPGTATNSSTLDIYRDAFTNNNLGLGSAKALVFFFIVLLITQGILKFFKSKEVEL